MKVCITTDMLTKRDLGVEVVETFLEIFKNATLTTMAFKEGEILGLVEQRNITSTSLTHKIKSYQDLNRFSFLAPGVLQNHFISCQYDLIINISRGLSHGFKKCESSRQITYLLDEEANPKGNTFFEKIFKSYVNKWALKKLNQVDELWVSSEALKEKLKGIYNKEILVVSPFIKVQDFPIIPKNVYPHNYYIINSEVIDIEVAHIIINIMNEKKYEYRFVGHDSHLNSLKKNNADHLFLGAKCNGDLSPLLAGSRGLIDLCKGRFPHLALCALCSGRPVVIGHNDYISGDGIFIVENESEESIMKQINKLDDCHKNFEPEKLHLHAIKFHQLKFKGTIQRRITKRA
ncbi:MAG: hypothetical protein HN576_11085 [Bacteriovoracaceae bacterium]|jgi:hypothetical protein|nr:hypothetical protein [Bacteriovoracaceae bacterium]